MADDDWRNWKNGRYDTRYRGVKRHSGQRNRKPIIAILVIVAVIIAGYLMYQNNFLDGILQKETKSAVNNAIKMQPALGGIIKPAVDTVSKITTQVSKQVSNAASQINSETSSSSSVSIEQTPQIN